MPIHEFFRSFDEKEERFSSIDDLPDNRSDIDRQFTPLSVYNQAKPDYAYAERLAEETINIGGAWVTVFLKQPYVDQEGIEDVWDEDPDPVYNQGFHMKAWVKVDSLNLELTRYGMDSPLQLTVVFPRAVLAKETGIERLLVPGDILEVPYNAPRLRGPARFRVINSYDSGNWHYRWLYFTTVCELILDDKSLKVPYQENSKVR